MNTKCPKELLYSMLCNMQLRLRLFRLKTLSRNYFKPLCVFGSYGKYNQRKIIYTLTEISHFKRKIIYVLILPSNNFRKPHLKRESSSTLLTRSKTHL